jgi:ISXO2-like transposase domain
MFRHPARRRRRWAHSRSNVTAVEGRGEVHTNTVEGSIFKRGMRGVYQHCAEKHLHRYQAEFHFRYNHRVALGFNDLERTAKIARGAEGKRLTYRAADSARPSA